MFCPRRAETGRLRLARLAHLDRATGRVIRRYERDRPGELVHVDIKKLGNIPDGGAGTRSWAGKRAARTAGTPVTATCTRPLTTIPAWPTAKSGVELTCAAGTHLRPGRVLCSSRHPYL